MVFFQNSVINKYIDSLDKKKVTTAYSKFRTHFHNSIIQENIRDNKKEQTEEEIKAIEASAENVLDVRTNFPKNTLADLYKITSMPPALVKTHNELDKAVDLAYRPQPFINEAKRMEFLFELYEKYTANLFTKEKVKKVKKKI